MVEKNMRKEVLWITRTAIFTALLVVVQAATASLGNTFVTGTMVNWLLIITVMTCGLASGLTIATISPIIAKLFGIGPFWILIPFIIIGNITLVVLWNLIGNRSFGDKKITSYIIAAIIAAVAKFVVLYLGVVQIAVPIILRLPEKQAMAISGMFSIPQLITALAGGVLAIIILPVMKEAISKNN